MRTFVARIQSNGVKQFIFIICLWLGLTTEVVAQDHPHGEDVVVADGFWKHWFVQAGLDMSLQNPYGYNFANVFPNGKTFGVDVAVGKWFTPLTGMRMKFNWENGIRLFENDHANWLAPFYEPGVNMDKGGYIALYGDYLLNLHNIFGTYKPDRKWNCILYPRIGVDYNFGVSKGAILAAAGFLNTYRLSNRWNVYLDAAYIMTGSGFVGAEKVEGTGTGSNSNGFFTIGLGAQVDLGNVKKEKGKKVKDDEHSVLTNGIWDNWFVQGGLDMCLLNPYGTNFSKVIPKGQTFGLNVAAGKWFSPEFALKVRAQWENGLIENKSLEWVGPKDDPRKNYQSGGFATVTLDANLNLTNVMTAYRPEKKWHASVYLRAGLITQFVESSGSPLMGAGIEQTYRLNNRWSLFGSAGYQVSTSEGMGYETTGMGVAAGSNGYFDIDLGVIYDLGENHFYRNSATKRKLSTTVPSKGAEAVGHNWPRFMFNTVASVAVGYVGKTALKKLVHEERPDHSDNESFPSGHATMAFAAARSLDKEFRKESIWIPIAGYAAATAIGVERVVNDRHHWYDVVAGAGLGFGAAELTWWLSDQLLGTGRRVAVGSDGQTVDVIVKL